MSAANLYQLSRNVADRSQLLSAIGRQTLPVGLPIVAFSADLQQLQQHWSDRTPSEACGLDPVPYTIPVQ